MLLPMQAALEGALDDGVVGGAGGGGARANARAQARAGSAVETVRTQAPPSSEQLAAGTVKAVKGLSA